MLDPITIKLQIDPLIESALREDITSEDISTKSVMPHKQMGEVDLIAKEDGIICGLSVFERVFFLLDAATQVTFFTQDGNAVKAQDRLACIRGDMRVLLSGERTALNYLQHMSGIATYTRAMAQVLEGTGIQLLDTRKTTPNNRIFEKYAVRVGGGHNHRYNLSDGVLLKDNHINAAGGVRQAIQMARTYAPAGKQIEIEVEKMEQVREAMDAGADIIMLDNMSYNQMEAALQIIDKQTKVEISGNMTRQRIALFANLGVNYISCGALTHSAPILDISMKHLRAVS